MQNEASPIAKQLTVLNFRVETFVRLFNEIINMQISPGFQLRIWSIGSLLLLALMTLCRPPPVPLLPVVIIFCDSSSKISAIIFIYLCFWWSKLKTRWSRFWAKLLTWFRSEAWHSLDWNGYFRKTLVCFRDNPFV